MKVAILIGVSNYDNFTSLPACKSDLTLMQELLEKTESYSDILSIGEDTNASRVKRIVSEWIEKQKEKEISEIFFYYTGHGLFQNEEFYFCFSDFDKSKFNTTGITNTEIDDWLRSLNADLAVKVIDACQSGIQYVKDTEIQFLNRIKRTNPKSFKHCYFMFSSQNDQSSFQDEELSFFTKAFIQAVKEYKEERIRYRDIMDYISDFFALDGSQRPHFVMDADSTEEFCTITENLRDFLQNNPYLQISVEENQTTEIVFQSLQEIVISNASKFCKEDEVNEILEELKKEIIEFSYNQEFVSLYEPKPSFEKGALENSKKSYIESLPNIEQIGQWLAKNSHEYFAKETYREESYPVKTSNLLGYRFPSETEWRTKNVISGLDVTSKFWFNTIKVIAEPKFLNLIPFECVIVFVLSKKEIRFFYYYADFREMNWKERKIERNVNWYTSFADLKNKNEIWNTVANIQNKFVDFVLEENRKRFGLILEQEQK